LEQNEEIKDLLCMSNDNA